MHAPDMPLARPRAVRRMEAACTWLAAAALIALVVLVTAEVIARSVFHFSFELVDEVGGYLLAALSFFALAPSLASRSFHNVEFIQQRISPAARRWSGIAFNALSLAFTLVLGTVVCRFVYRSWQQDDVASTHLQTPLWIPQLAMIAGIAALAMTLVTLLIAQWRDSPQAHGGDGNKDYP